jgi:hypothetical protein
MPCRAFQPQLTFLNIVWVGRLQTKKWRAVALLQMALAMCVGNEQQSQMTLETMVVTTK